MALNVAVVGCGNMGKLHCRVYGELEESNLVAVVDVDETSIKKISEKYNCKYYISLEEMLTNEKIDAVTIAVPTKYHFEVAKKIIEDGKHVLIEKPIAETLVQADELIKLAKENKVKLMVGHIERFNPVIQFTKKLIEQNALGEALMFSVRRVGAVSNMQIYGDITLDLAIHDIDVIRYLSGQEIEKVYCNKSRLNNDGKYLNNAFGTLQLSGGSLGVFETNWITQKKVRKMTITLEKATVDLDYITQDIEIHKSTNYDSHLDGFEQYTSQYTQGVIEKPIISKKEPLKQELKYFIECINEGIEPPVTGADGKNALEVALACNKSIKTGLPVVISNE